MRYSDADLAAAGGDPGLLTLCRYDEDAGEWVALSTTVNTAAMTLSATTDRFSMWMIMVANGGGEGSPLMTFWLWIIAGVGALVVGTAVLILVPTAIIYGRRRAHRRRGLLSARMRWG